MKRKYPGQWAVRIEVVAPNGQTISIEGAVDKATAERTIALLTEISKAPPVKSEWTRTEAKTNG